MYEYEVEIRGAGHQVHSLHYKSFASIEGKNLKIRHDNINKGRRGEEETTIERDLQTLRDWINKSRHLQNIRKGE